MFNYISVLHACNTALNIYSAARDAEKAAKAAFEAASFGDPDFHAKCIAHIRAEEHAKTVWQTQVAAIFERHDAGQRALTGCIDGSELDYREAKENIEASLELVKSRETDCHERAWAARWLRGAQRFPSLAGHLIPALKEAHGWFVAAVALEEIKDCKGMYRTLRRIVDEDQTETGVETACAEFRRAMREQGATGDAADLFAQFDVLHLLGVNPF